MIGNLQANGKTALNKALKSAADKLEEFVAKYPSKDCKKLAYK